MSYTKNKRDENEARLMEVWAKIGCLYIQMDKDAGFDGVLISPHTGVHIVEVKNPSRKWILTDAEKKVKAEVEAREGNYNIIESIDDAVRLAMEKFD